MNMMIKHKSHLNNLHLMVALKHAMRVDLIDAPMSEMQAKYAGRPSVDVVGIDGDTIELYFDRACEYVPVTGADLMMAYSEQSGLPADRFSLHPMSEISQNGVVEHRWLEGYTGMAHDVNDPVFPTYCTTNRHKFIAKPIKKRQRRLSYS